MITMTVTGLKELDRNLKKLELKAATKVLRTTARLAMEPMLLAAKNNAENIADSGATALAMGSAIRKTPKGVYAQIGPKSKQKRALAAYNELREQRGQSPVERLRHFHLAEFGGGYTPGYRFMTRAFDAHAPRVPFRIRAIMRQELKKFL